MQSVDNAVTDVVFATKKFFKRVLPIMLVMLVCNQLNRSNIGYAQEHLQADVGIGAAAYGFGAGLFFIAYAIFELPSNVMMEKYGAKVWLARIMISWGIVSFLMVFVQNETMFYALRFLLGAAEAGFFPAVIFYFARWVPAGQRGKATAIFIAGSSVAAALSGPIAGMLLSLHDVLGFRGWQWLFGFEGLLSVVVGIAVFFVLDAKIADATWLTAGEKFALTAAIADEDAQHANASGGNPSGKINRWKMLLNPQILLLCGIYFSVQLSIYANTFWLPSIVKQIPGTTDLSVGFLSAIPWVCAVIAMYFAAKWQDKAKSKRPLLVAALLVAAVGTLAAAVAIPGPGPRVPGHRRHGIQERVTVVLDHPPVRPAPPHPRAGHCHHQLPGQPRWLRGPVWFRHHQGADRQRHPGALRPRSGIDNRRRARVLPQGAQDRSRGRAHGCARGGVAVTQWPPNRRTRKGKAGTRRAPAFPSPMPRSVALACVLQVPVELFFGFAAPLTDDAQLLRDRISVAINVAVMRALQALGAGGQGQPRFSIFAHTGMIPHCPPAEKGLFQPRKLAGTPGSLRARVPMQVRVEGMAAGQPGQQDPQLRRLFAGERGQEFGLVPFGDSAQCSENLRALGRQPELVVPPVGAAAHAGNQASRFQRVDEGNNAARHRPQAVGQGPLAQPGVAAEQAEDARVAWGQAELAGAFGEACRCQRPELGQQESGSLRPRRIR